MRNFGKVARNIGLGMNRNVSVDLSIPQRIADFGAKYTTPLSTQPGGVNNAPPTSPAATRRSDRAKVTFSTRCGRPTGRCAITASW